MIIYYEAIVKAIQTLIYLVQENGLQLALTKQPSSHEEGR